MRRYAATGPSKVHAGDVFDYVESVVANLRPAPSEVTTGAAPGVDTVFCLAAIKHWPGAHHRVVVPYAPHNEDLIALLEAEHPQVEIERMPVVYADTDRDLRRKAYRRRNQRMVGYIPNGTLIAFLWRAVWYRSGEWMTTRIAEDAGVSIEQHILS